MSARVIVIGTGPIGGIIGGRLARAGNDMTFVDVAIRSTWPPSARRDSR